MDTPNTVKKTTEYLKKSLSVTMKVFLIGFIMLVLLIPASMVESRVDERQSRSNEVIGEISGKWGAKQTISGPFIALPYKSWFKDDKGNAQYSTKYINILPEELAITGDLKTEVRYRSIYEAVLYNAKLAITGSFVLPSAGQLDIEAKDILWDKAYLTLGISDMTGIKDNIAFTLNGKEFNANPGVRSTDLTYAGVGSVVTNLTQNSANTFKVSLDLNGSGYLKFIPVGKTTTVHLQSAWDSPSFNGAFLPSTREINDSGFTADWKVLHLNRNFPQFWDDGAYKQKENFERDGSRNSINESAFGVELKKAVDIYQKSTRLAKYAIVFLVFTYAAFFLSEVITKRRVHAIQYILVGLAILMFYTLELALSEYMHFNIAYGFSALLITLMITGYAKAIVPTSRFALVIAGLLTVLYAYLFIVLQLEDYAFLMGSVGLVAVLGAVMYLTRRINWYEIEAE